MQYKSSEAVGLLNYIQFAVWVQRGRLFMIVVHDTSQRELINTLPTLVVTINFVVIWKRAV